MPEKWCVLILFVIGRHEIQIIERFLERPIDRSNMKLDLTRFDLQIYVHMSFHQLKAREGLLFCFNFFADDSSASCVSNHDHHVLSIGAIDKEKYWTILLPQRMTGAMRKHCDGFMHKSSISAGK